jgi:hypothetical protein
MYGTSHPVSNDQDFKVMQLSDLLWKAELSQTTAESAVNASKKI